MNDPLNTIDAEQLENSVSNAFKTMHKSARHFQEVPSVQNIANEIKGWIDDFKPFIPLIQGLRNPGMRSRHWDQVSLYSESARSCISVKNRESEIKECLYYGITHIYLNQTRV